MAHNPCHFGMCPHTLVERVHTIPCQTFPSNEWTTTMGLAQRAQRIVDERARQRYAERDAAERQRQAEAAEYHRTHLDRERAAAFLEISPHRLKRLMAANTGPACQKSGPHKQSPVVWTLAELEAWKADPAAYIAARNVASP